jgi:hypothetical protein
MGDGRNAPPRGCAVSADLSAENGRKGAKT